MKKLLIGNLIVFLLFLSLNQSVLSQIVWTGGAGDGNWSNGLNWMGGSAPSPVQSAQFNSGTALITSGLPASIAGLAVGNATLILQNGTLTVNTISNTAGSRLELNGGTLVIGAGSTIMNGTLVLRSGSTLTLNAGISLSGISKVQVDGNPTVNGMLVPAISYTSNDTLEFIGSANTTIQAKYVQNGTMNGSIVINKTGGAVNGVPQMLQVNGSFLLRQGTWNVNANGWLRFAGTTTYYTTTTGTALNINPNGILELGPNRVFTNDGVTSIASEGAITINDGASVLGAGNLNYQSTMATLNYFGAGNKITTAQELPPVMQGGVFVRRNAQGLILGSSTQVMGSFTIATFGFTTGTSTLILSGGALIQAPSTLGISPNGKVIVSDGRAIMKAGNIAVQGLGTLNLDGQGYIIGGSTFANYQVGSNLLYTGSGNRVATEIPNPPSTLNANFLIDKSAGTILDMPGTPANVVTLQSTVRFSITSGTLRTLGVGKFKIDNFSPNAVTSGTLGMVDGPLQWRISSSFSSYFFPLGKNTAKYPFQLTDVSVSMPVTMEVEAFQTMSNGTPSGELTFLHQSEYWRLRQIDAMPATLNNIRAGISRSGGWSNPAAVGYCQTVNGSYISLGGSVLQTSPTFLTANGVSNIMIYGIDQFFNAGQVSRSVRAGLGYQLSFNGINQEVVASPRSSYDSLSAFTFEALVRPMWMSGTPPTDPCIASFGDAAGQNFTLSMGRFLGALKVGTNNNSTAVIKTVIPAFRRNQYYHIAITYNAGIVTYFVDGKLMGTDNITINAVNGKSFRIGSRGGAGDWWQGFIDEVRIWNTVLPQSVIATWKRRELDNSHSNITNLRGYWNFNDGYPQTAADASFLGNTANLINLPAWMDGSTNAGVVVAPNAVSSGFVPFKKIGSGMISHTLLGSNGGSTIASVSLNASDGAITYSPNFLPLQDARDTVTHIVSDTQPMTYSSISSVSVEFQPILFPQTQYVSYNKPTMFAQMPIYGGTSPFLGLWSPTTNLNNAAILQPTATLGTNANYTFQMQDGYGFVGTYNVPVLIHPYTFAFSLFSTLASASVLPMLVNSGNPFVMRYGVFRKRTGTTDSVSAGVALHVAPIAGGNAQFSFKYDSSLVNIDRIVASGIVINWLNAPLSGGTTQAIVTLYRTGGAAIDAVQQQITISSNASAPIITSFSPVNGGNGTWVTVTGANFVNVSSVRFGAVLAQSFVVVSPTELRAQVASGTTGPVTVSAMAGSGSSINFFTYLPAPSISSFTPTQGASGATVRVLGTNFFPPVTVRFGGVPATNIDVVTANELYAEVTLGATGNVSVTTPGGTATSATVFTYFGAPFITNINPTQGTAGDTITVSGGNFNNVDSIRIGTTLLGGGKGTAILPIQPTTLRIKLDTGAVNGVITIFAEGGQGVSSQSFTYVSPPKIDSISPRVGGAGTAITVFGKNFALFDSLRFNGVRLQSPTITSTTRLTAVMPTNVPSSIVNSTAAIVIFTRAGRDSSKTPHLFNYVGSPTISGFSPNALGIGAWTTVTGANFVAVQSIAVNGINADSIKVVSPNSVQVKIPAGAMTGKVSLVAAGGSVMSSQDLRIVPAPSISGFSPTTASSGATIEILGKDFVNVVRVSLIPTTLGNGVNAITLANITVPSETRILATIPSNAASGLLSVETAQGVAISSSPLQITIPTGPPPIILGYTPAAGEVGSEVFISGTNIANFTNVSIGNTSAATVKVVSPSLLSIIVPEDASSGTLRITTPNGTAFSFGTFQVLKALTGDGFTPFQRDSSVLVRFYQSSGGNWLREENWLTNLTVSSWAGVTVDSGRIVRLQLANNSIQGGLPSFLSELKELQVLDLSGNFLEGAVPSSIATMSSLRELRLGNNRFSGVLPNLSTMANLQVLSVENNRFVGEFPQGLCNVRTLRHLNLSNNAFSGTLPQCIGSLTAVQRMNLSDNLFSGTLPSEIGSMVSLQELELRNNQFSGVFPTTLGTTATQSTNAVVGQNKEMAAALNATPVLTLLDLRNNQFSGIIPQSLGSLRSLRTLLLSNNRFTGAIPSSLGNCSDLQRLEARNNQLSGTIPSSFGELRKLQTLSLQSNSLVGTLPNEMGRMLALTALYLDSNAISGVSDSLTNLSSLKVFTLSSNQCSRLPQLRGLDSVNVSRNRLQFSALDGITNAKVFLYTPQDSIFTPIDTTIQVFTPFIASSVSDGGRDYQWYKIVGERGVSERIFQLGGQTSPNLVFERITRPDTGMYTCFVRNSKYPNLTLIRRVLTVRALPPSAPREIPVLVTPPNNAQSIPLTATLRWTTFATISGYEVQISTSADFSIVQWQTSTTNPFIGSQQIPQAASLLNLTSYFWRVRSLSEGLTGAWSQVFRFTTQPANQPLNVETVDFGRVVVERTSKAMDLRLRNLSNVALLVQNVQIQSVQLLNFQTQRLQTVDASSLFRIVSPFTSTRLDLDEELTIPLVFSPKAVGEYRATVVVTFVPAAGGTPSVLTFQSALIGRGGILVIDSLSFGTVTGGVTRTTTLRMRNIGLDTVRVQGVEFAPVADSMGGVQKITITLAERSLAGLILRPNDSLLVNVSCQSEITAKQGLMHSSVNIFSTLDTVYQVPVSLILRTPNPNDVTIATVLVPEADNVAPGGVVVLALKIQNVVTTRTTSGNLADVYATGNPEFSGEIEFDRNVLVLDAAERGVLPVSARSESSSLVRFRIPTTRWTPDAQGKLLPDLLKIRCRAVSGEFTTTPLRITRLEWNNISDAKSGFVLITTSTGSFTSAACEAGGTRLTTGAKAGALRVTSQNPISDILRIAFTLREDADFDLSLTDVLGNIAWKHHETAFQAGEYQAEVNMSHLASGLYFLRLVTPTSVLVQRIEVIR